MNESVTQGQAELWQRALAVIPGGVNSPVRSFCGVGSTPFFAARGEGPFLWDTEGRCYIDYVLSWGPLILGHAPPVAIAALAEQLGRGTSYGAPTAVGSRAGRAHSPA